MPDSDIEDFQEIDENEENVNEDVFLENEDLDNSNDIEVNQLYSMVSIEDIYKNYNIKNNISNPKMTKYEKTKIVGIRAQQLANGSRPRIKVPVHVTDTINIAELELEQRKIPFIIKRSLPSGSIEYWKINDLIY